MAAIDELKPRIDHTFNELKKTLDEAGKGRPAFTSQVVAAVELLSGLAEVVAAQQKQIEALEKKPATMS